MRLRQIDAAEQQCQLLAGEFDRRSRRHRPGQRPGLQTFGTEPPARVVPEQDLDAVLPRVGEDEQVTRERIESKRLANDARQGVEGLPQIGSPGCEVNPCVREKAQHGGNWARSSPTQPNSAPSGTRSFHPLGDTISGQSHGVAAADDRAGGFCRTSTATNRGGDVGSIPRPALLAGGLAPSTGVVRIQRFTVSGWTPTFWANSRWLSPESRNSRIS